MYCGFIGYLKKEIKYLRAKEDYLRKLIKKNECAACMGKLNKCRAKRKRVEKRMKKCAKKPVKVCIKAPCKPALPSHHK